VARIAIEVVHALADEQEVVALSLDPGATVRDALEASGLLRRYPGIDATKESAVGVFGRIVALDTELAHGDRVELYRPLQADPKEARRRRARPGR
jgi:putative ubiquitin-RnfH superfamily antitoxin RatB of RatAB toxin-antitoxin module